MTRSLRPAMATISWLSLVALLLVGAPRGLSQGLPDRVLVGYWHNWGSSPNGLTLASIPAEYDVIIVAFATPTVPLGSTMSFTPDPGIYPNPQAFISDVQALQAQGQEGPDLRRRRQRPGACQHALRRAGLRRHHARRSSPPTASTAWTSISRAAPLMLQGGDVDFANPTTPTIVNFISAVNQLTSALPPTFMLTAAPETALLQGGYIAYAGVWGAYLPVIHALRNQLTFVHTQHYNTGTMYGLNGQLYTPATADFHVAMADMLLTGFVVSGAGTFPPLAAHQVAIGLPASTQAAGSGYTPPSVVHDALDKLILGRPVGGTYPLANPSGYPAFRGLMTWSINWDVNAGGQFSIPHRHYLDHVHLDTDTATLSVTTGGTVNFTLQPGIANANRPYYLIPTASGTSPGTPLSPGVVLPINLDPLWLFAHSPAGAPFFPGISGTLDSWGEATAQLVLPPVPGAPSFPLHFAYALAFPFDFASPAVQVDLVP